MKEINRYIKGQYFILYLLVVVDSEWQFQAFSLSPEFKLLVVIETRDDDEDEYYDDDDEDNGDKTVERQPRTHLYKLKSFDNF